MNRFRIVLGKEKEFETIWKNRDTHLDDVPGFEKFHLAKGNTEGTHTLYISHSTWSSKQISSTGANPKHSGWHIKGPEGIVVSI